MVQLQQQRARVATCQYHYSICTQPIAREGTGVDAYVLEDIRTYVHMYM